MAHTPGEWYAHVVLLKLDEEEPCYGQGRFLHYDASVRQHGVRVPALDLGKYVDWLNQHKCKWSWEPKPHLTETVRALGKDHPWVEMMLYFENIDQAALMKMSI
jgi:hypothetical protein